MPFFEFFRNFFNRGSSQELPQQRFEDEQQYKDSFKNPIWQSDEDEDDVSDFSNRIPRNRHQFRIFSDPFEMTRFFETQMDEMIKNIFGFGTGFGNNSSIFLPFGKDENMLEIPDEKQNIVKPRDEVLKSDDTDSKLTFDDFLSGIPALDGNFSRTGPVDEVLKPSYELPDINSQKLDKDLDGKIKSDQLAKIWKTPCENSDRFSPQSSISSFGSSVSTQIIKRSDGSVEERRKVKDSNGNQEIKVTRKIGDKIHTVTTKIAKDGSEVKTEDVINMDESELKGFDEKWMKIRNPSTNQRDDFPWYKFFGPNPKL